MAIEVRKVYRSGNIVGLPVRNPLGEDLGRVEEVAVHLETGQVAYLALSLGGYPSFARYLGMGGKLFAVPWEAVSLRYDETHRYFVVQADAATLSQMRGFNPHHWPDGPDPRWADIESRYHQRHQKAEARPATAAPPPPAEHS